MNVCANQPVYWPGVDKSIKNYRDTDFHHQKQLSHSFEHIQLSGHSSKYILIILALIITLIY